MDALPLLGLFDVRRTYEDVVALAGVTLEVAEGEIIALLGPSGSGKSTLLRCVAGLEPLDGGRITLRGREISHVPTHLRDIGMMFQQFALFPHRTVFDNIAFGLRMQAWEPETIAVRVQEMLDLVGLAGYGARSIFEISGGEQQRVALARSLAPSPRLLLLDEPLGALDRRLRERLMEELHEILTAIGMTAIYVTHDQQEAFAIADRLFLLDRGRIVQAGTPEALYRRPANRFAAEFFGHDNLLPVFHVKQGEGAALVARTALGDLTVSDSPPGAHLLIRPEAARLAPVDGDAPNRIHGTVAERAFRGGYYRVVTDHDGIRLRWRLGVSGEELPPRGAPIALDLRPNGLVFVPEAEG